MALEPLSLALGLSLGSICGYLLGLLAESERESSELARYNDLKVEVERLRIELSRVDERGEAFRDLERRIKAAEEEIDEILKRARKGREGRGRALRGLRLRLHALLGDEGARRHRQ